MYWSWLLLCLSMVTMVTEGYGHTHCSHPCIAHCCPGNQGTHDCSGCHSGCCPTTTAVTAVYSEWSACTATCGGGTQFRHCITNCPQQHMSEDQQVCNTHACPVLSVNGGWSAWSSWSACLATCGPSHRHRTRVCNNPAPQHGGHSCHGHTFEKEACTNGDCPVHGHWGAWMGWSACSTTCGKGQKTRFRHCDNPAPANGGNHCYGQNSQHQACHTNNTCTVHGHWGAWMGWSACSTTCGKGQKTRFRHCDNPAPANGGNHCYGQNSQHQACHTNNTCTVAVNGGWSAWFGWSSCSVDCGTGGQRKRMRICDSPVPQHGGDYCPGIQFDMEACNGTNCTSGTLHHCDKLSVLHALAEINITSQVTCLNNWVTETEDFVKQHCSAPDDVSKWQRGDQVLNICPLSSLPNHLYVPVGTFSGGTYGMQLTRFAGIFVGCNANNTGFRIATRICGGVAEIIEIPLPASYNHTSTGVIPNNPADYHFIKWV
ncbi:coadhesin-like isoform X2 [Argopecten irradians]|uniref:coadhesin-like isoform X2 n=1 Tax=Argopecten irradians TaxID=31199 RepID=UPI00371BA517